MTNTAESIEEPDENSADQATDQAADEQPQMSEELSSTAETGEVALDEQAPESAANQADDEVGEHAQDPAQNLQEPSASTDSGATTDLGLILDIPVTLSMEIGQTRITISELLKLSKDSVVELQRSTDEPLDVLVNGTLVAHGEAVVVGDRFGIRLTDVIGPQERLHKFT